MYLLREVRQGALVQILQDKGNLSTVWNPIGSKKLHQGWVYNTAKAPDVIEDLLALLLQHCVSMRGAFNCQVVMVSSMCSTTGTNTKSLSDRISVPIGLYLVNAADALYGHKAASRTPPGLVDLKGKPPISSKTSALLELGCH